MSTEIVKINPAEFGLEETKAQEIANQFKPMLDKMVELEKEANEVFTLDINQPKTSAKAKEVRLKYVKVRTGTAEIHKAQKAFYLAGGRFVDGWKNAQLFASQGIEERLEAIEKHFENLEKERISKLQSEREGLLMDYNVENIYTLNLGTMNEDVFNNFLLGTKQNYEAKIEAERKAEEERIAKEKAEAEERERVRIENEKLQAQLKKEREENEAKQKAIEEKAKAEREEMERKAKEEKIKQDAILLEQKRIAYEEAKKQAEIIAKQQAELQAKKDAEIKEQKEREETERKAKLEAEKLSKAPIKKQLKVWVDSFQITETEINNETSKAIKEKFESFKQWALSQIDSI